MKIALLLAGVMLVGCAADDTTTDDPDDASSEVAPGAGKADGTATALFGNYDLNQILDGSPQNAEGDVISLSLFAELDGSRPTPPANTTGAYVRVRAYHGGTALVAQTDTFKLFTSGGKTYIEFRGFEWTNMANLDVKSVVEDVYEYKVVSGSLHLRKTYTSRWQGLEKVSDQTVCTNSGGVWDPAHPATGARPDTTTPCNCTAGKTFVPGASGCMVPADPGESTCDDTKGYYTDDDSTYLGSFCVCPSGYAIHASGCAKL